MRKAILATAGAALLLVPAAPATAKTPDVCIGSPNIIRDVTDCVQRVLDNCTPGSTIIADVLECLK